MNQILDTGSSDNNKKKKNKEYINITPEDNNDLELKIENEDETFDYEDIISDNGSEMDFDYGNILDSIDETTNNKYELSDKNKNDDLGFIDDTDEYDDYIGDESNYNPINYNGNENDYSSNDYNYESPNKISNYANEYNSGSAKVIEMKKIIIIFALAILLFGICIAGVLIFRYVKNNKIKNSVPEVVMEEIQEGSVKISANWKKGISKVVFYWNDGDENLIDSTGATVNKLIEIPKGKNTLKVVVYDKEGKYQEFTKDFENNTDKEKPTIELSIIEDTGDLKITATDDTEIKYLTYQWNEEKAKTVYPDDEGETIIEKSIEIKRGKNTLKITAVDASENEAVEEKMFNGVEDPEIDLYVMNGYLCMTISHNLGLEEVTFEINGEEFVFDSTAESYEEEKLLLKRKIQLLEGNNSIKIKAKSVEDTENSYEDEYEYIPEE